MVIFLALCLSHESAIPPKDKSVAEAAVFFINMRLFISYQLV
jgi:hypothetical protein